jgi:ubiquinone/menaquinone biosynthesis C-methylase UbiE
MNGLTELVNSFYNNFILRDIVAKIVPGVLLAYSIATLKYEPARILKFIREASTIELAFLIAASWVIAFGVQAMGEARGLIRLWPKGLGSDKARKRIVCFGRRATAEEKRIVERYVVVKEACGLGYLAFLIALVMILAGDAGRSGAGFGPALWISLSSHKMLIGSTLLLSAALWWTHDKHLKRQYDTYDAVDQEYANDQTSTDCPTERSLAESFAENPESYDYYRVDYPAEILDHLMEASNLRRGHKALEIGAGSGKFTRHLVRAGLHVRCIEPAKGFVEFLKKHFDSEIEITASKFEDLDPTQTRYHLVVAAQSFHWIPWEEGLRKAAYLLEPDGYVGFVFYSTKIADGELREQLDQIYEHYPAVEARLPGSGPSSRQSPVAKIENAGLYKKPMVFEVRKTYHHSCWEYRMLAETESQHKKLNTGERAKLMEAACEAITKNGGFIETEYVFTLVLAQRALPQK